MPPAKQVTISCSVCSRLSAVSAATRMATGRIITMSCGIANRVIFRKIRGLCRWSTRMSRPERLWLRRAMAERAAVASSVGPSSCRKR
jgi:hypothetical protein